jgi:tetratricopeptide (TPR) repeat protein
MVGDFNRAINALSNAIKFKPNSPSVYVQRGNCYYYLDKNGEASKDWQKAIELNPELESKLRLKLTK